ncbi:WbqC family protein [Ferruginibacter paludis]|uniref:WbqC family protein n=1 Tax=Ferruginibacter paludis TaxID=1310417 RepID=UPI0025B49A93|nr:WbqC family protein [Ferruginibacter paludis]MDN3655878.1 WbqC family protein [Ferruginibacter paludis]
MKLSIMQPYLFPYLGYFQLINAVDKFVVYDDVAFIKQGWINRNFLLLNGRKYLFTFPVKSISSNAPINETFVSKTPFNWQQKLQQTIIQAYRKAPFFKDVFPMVESIISQSTDKPIAQVATESIEAVVKYLSIKTDIQLSSSIYENDHLKNTDRVIDICTKENAIAYINAIGGQQLYKQETFAQKKINLYFIKSTLPAYEQFDREFINGLSIIDVMMFNSPEKVKNDFLPMYSLV